MSHCAPRIAGVLALFVALAGVDVGRTPQAAPPTAASSTDPISGFLARYWVDPLPPQGEPPAAFSPLEASLGPGSCGKCHVQQLRDWKSSLHSRTMGPGILWQFHIMGPRASNACLRCHAPLAEQKALLAQERGWKNAPVTPPPPYVPADLHRQGLVCAACHVRQHARFGPPPRQPASRTLGTDLPHGGFSARAGFEDSRFCAVCHQFKADGAQLNGKLLENTFEEWRGSPAARQGRTCQSCHMPDRRHLWRGIHDADMTRRALRASLEVRGVRGEIRVRAELANVGAGHDFPTYLVPKVVATLELLDADGNVRSQLARRVIGREVDLQLSQEIFDTRLAPGERLRFGARFPSPRAAGWQVRLRVVVHPGEHYERLFRSLLARSERMPPDAASLLRQALAQLASSRYELYRLTRPLPAR